MSPSEPAEKAIVALTPLIIKNIPILQFAVNYMRMHNVFTRDECSFIMDNGERKLFLKVLLTKDDYYKHLLNYFKDHHQMHVHNRLKAYIEVHLPVATVAPHTNSANDV